MDELNNSHKKRSAQEEPTKKIEKVVVGEVTIRKKPWHKRVAEGFFAGRADVAADYVISDVLLPSARNALYDMGTSFLDSVINGNRTARSLANRAIPGQSVGAYVGQQFQQQVNYNGIGKQVPGGPNFVTRAARPGSDIGQFVFATRVEAEAVIDELFRAIQQYNAVTVSDLFEMCGKTAPYTDDRFGWQDIRGAGVIPVRGGGFVLDLPSPIVLD